LLIEEPAPGSHAARVHIVGAPSQLGATSVEVAPRSMVSAHRSFTTFVDDCEREVTRLSAKGRG